MQFRTLVVCLIAGLVALPITQVATTGTASAGNLEVDCDKGENVQAAVDKAEPGDTIQIDGSCTGSVTINGANIGLVAGPSGGGIASPDPALNTIQVFATNVRVQGLAVTGGRTGIIVLRGGSAVVENNVVSGYAQSGISVVQNGHGRLSGNTVTGDGTQSGIVVTLGGAADLFQNTVSGNGTGVLLSRNAAADIVGNTITGNAGNGVSILRASVADFSNDSILGNAPNTIEGNGGPGILCVHNSVAGYGTPQDFGAGNGGGNVFPATTTTDTCVVVGSPFPF